MWRLVIALSLIAAEAAGEVVEVPRPAADPERGNFWRDLVEPHKAEIDVILVKVRQAIQQADNALYQDSDPTGQERTRFFREIYGVLRFARRLAPDNLEVLRYYAQAADELGKTRQAIEALHTAIDLAGVDKAGPEITGRLGAIYLRLGQLDDAIRYLRAAQGPLVPSQAITAHVLVHLANALAARGEMAEAIDTLANSLPPTVPYYSNEVALVSFALAVLYDRDEQRGAAFDVLDHMQTAQQGQLPAQLQNALATMRFAPAEDQHYFLGLLYEASGNYPEARAEWAMYAAAGDLPYRSRALDHVLALDADRHPPAAAVPPNVRRHSIRPMVPAP